MLGCHQSHILAESSSHTGDQTSAKPAQNKYVLNNEIMDIYTA